MDSPAPFIGIDIGTSKSTMAWYDPKDHETKPERSRMIHAANSSHPQ
jgi:molecular chaperone DnaK (HSP70)